MVEKIQTYILVQHKVSDLAKWKQNFERNDPRWEAAGMRLMHLFHSADDENEVTMIFEVDDIIMMQLHISKGAVTPKVIDTDLIVGDIKFDILEKLR